MPHLPLKQFNPRSLSASSVSSFDPQFAGLAGASLFTGLFRIRGTTRRPMGRGRGDAGRDLCEAWILTSFTPEAVVS